METLEILVSLGTSRFKGFKGEPNHYFFRGEGGLKFRGRVVTPNDTIPDKFWKKGFVKKFASRENTCLGVSF